MMFRYRTIERALIHACKIPSDKLGAFRGRIKNLQRFGIPHGSNVGKGHPADYTYEDAAMILLVLVLDSWRSRPQDISAAVMRHWDKIVAGISRARAGEQMMLCAYPGFVTARWKGEDHMPIECRPFEQAEAEVFDINDKWIEYVPLNPWLIQLEEGITRLRVKPAAEVSPC